MRSLKCVILFTKAPLEKHVKTRLTDKGFFNAEQSRMIYEAFLSDVLTTVIRYTARNNIDLFISYTPQEGLNKIIEIIRRLQNPARVTGLNPQQGTTFGQRMNSAFRRVFEADYEEAVIIGGDSPTIRESHLADAFTLLHNSKDFDRDIVVVGPAIDGGVYLIGLRKGTSLDFEDIFQKKDGVDISLSILESRAQKMSMQLLRTEIFYDVDNPADLKILSEELSKNQYRAPHTHRVLRELGQL